MNWHNYWFGMLVCALALWTFARDKVAESIRESPSRAVLDLLVFLFAWPIIFPLAILKAAKRGLNR